jgi:hypothetical protein
MRRHMIRPFGQSISPMRTISLFMLLALLWMAWNWVRDPAILQWIGKTTADQQLPDVGSEADTTSQVVDTEETIVPGPNDTDPIAAKDLNSKLDLVTDKVELRPGEMPLYWRLMGWARTESFEKLKKRAAKDVPFSQIYGEPSEYRGKLIHLRLHVRRVLPYKAYDNPLYMKMVYEAWGWTEDSKSYPYVIVFPERPPGLPIGTDVRAEIEFTGYFLKVMKYTAYNANLGAPLLIGRIKVVEMPVQSKSAVGTSYESLGIAAIGLTALIGISMWQLFRKKKGLTGRRSLPDELSLDVDREEQLFAENVTPNETKPETDGSAPVEGSSR